MQSIPDIINNHLLPLFIRIFAAHVCVQAVLFASSLHHQQYICNSRTLLQTFVLAPLLCRAATHWSVPTFVPLQAARLSTELRQTAASCNDTMEQHETAIEQRLVAEIEHSNKLAKDLEGMMELAAHQVRVVCELQREFSALFVVLGKLRVCIWCVVLFMLWAVACMACPVQCVAAWG